MSSHPDIAKVSFTGSTAIGKSILGSGAQTLKRVTLELGGKSPVLILEDADLNSRRAHGHPGRFHEQRSGLCCRHSNSGTRTSPG